MKFTNSMLWFTKCKEKVLDNNFKFCPLNFKNPFDIVANLDTIFRLTFVPPDELMLKAPVRFSHLVN